MLKKILTTIVAFGVLAFTAGGAAAQEAPDALVKRISHEVLDAAKADKEIQAGNQKKILELVEAKILPYVDSQRMTALAATGARRRRNRRSACPRNSAICWCTPIRVPFRKCATRSLSSSLSVAILPMPKWKCARK
jgi:hypothetical protein